MHRKRTCKCRHGPAHFEYRNDVDQAVLADVDLGAEAVRSATPPHLTVAVSSLQQSPVDLDAVVLALCGRPHEKEDVEDALFPARTNEEEEEEECGKKRNPKAAQADSTIPENVRRYNFFHNWVLS